MGKPPHPISRHTSQARVDVQLWECVRKKILVAAVQTRVWKVGAYKHPFVVDVDDMGQDGNFQSQECSTKENGLAIPLPN
jgi:hypothetical protein